MSAVPLTLVKRPIPLDRGIVVGEADFRLLRIDQVGGGARRAGNG